LAINFGLSIQKTIFPYEFVNDCSLYYLGQVPDRKYYPPGTFSSEQEYIDYINAEYPNKM
jgi:hypothetical protein